MTPLDLIVWAFALAVSVFVVGVSVAIVVSILKRDHR